MTKIYYFCGVKAICRALWVVIALCLAGCSATKHVPDGRMLLEDVDIKINGDREAGTATELVNFLRQTPNHKVLGFAKLQLSTYSLSGRDSTKWYNRWLQRIGQPPVIYDSVLTDASARQLRQAMINRGYMDASVTVDKRLRPEDKRAALTYNIITGTPHTIRSLQLNVADSAALSILRRDSMLTRIEPGSLLDRNRLDNMRTDIATRMRQLGYYAFSKELITFTADTVAGDKEVALTLNLASTGVQRDTVFSPSKIYMVRSVRFVTEQALESGVRDTVDYRTISVVYGADRYIRPSALYDMCFIEPGKPYDSREIDRTYASLSRLSILRFINIEMVPAGTVGDIGLLDAVITISRNRKQSVTLELEGTNSEGDLGFGVGATYQHRDLTHRSDMLSVKFRTAYESLSGNLDGLINKRYSEYAAEVGLTLPKFILPGATREFKKRMQATTEIALSFNYQERPEYTRVIFGAAWRWKWNNRRLDFNRRHTFDLLDINYVRLPHSTINFIDQIAPDNPLLRYSYEDHFIMRMGYSFYRTNRRIPTPEVNAFAMQPWISTLRVSAETAGNLLYGLSNLLGARRTDGAYKVFGIQYAQYVKGEVDYTFTRNFNSRNALAVHTGFGIAVPYANSSMVPFEKRFYAGGANGVRGWGVRTLGPGEYEGRNYVSDFINQCGDIRLDLSVEYRAKLFWVFEGAVFIDAGNIWTIRDYPTQPGGVFRFNKFYRQIAASYGAGIRMDFTYFLLRFDLGLKAHNPARNQEPWPLLHPRWGRDANFHFSVGYPF